MLLVLDVGNTNITIGLYADDQLLVHWRLSTRKDATEDELATVLYELFNYHGYSMRDVKSAAIACVVPPLMLPVTQMVRAYFHCEPLVVGPGVRTGMPIRYDNPREVGADRIVNAVAAYMLYGGPVIVVDFGTATTFDAISKAGEYLGGAIAPGVAISTEALFEKAAKLPRVELLKPKSVIGKNTVASIQSGIIYGFVGQVDGIVRRMKREMGGTAFVVATGGLAPLICPETETIDKLDPLLTLEGLRLIHKLNR